MENLLHIYHGSDHIIETPEFGKGRKHNDYGLGFYCTESPDLAKEWACAAAQDGYSNHYILDTSGLRILDLGNGSYSILNWIQVLVENRVFSSNTPVAGRAKKYLKENFDVNVNAYDIIKGYRADDAYFDFAEAFLNNAITVGQLSRAMILGDLGEQIVLKSKLAFDSLAFVDHEAADSSIFGPAGRAREERAKADFDELCEEQSDGIYMIDIMREGMTNDDERIPKVIR